MTKQNISWLNKYTLNMWFLSFVVSLNYDLNETFYTSKTFHLSPSFLQKVHTALCSLMVFVLWIFRVVLQTLQDRQKYVDWTWNIFTFLENWWDEVILYKLLHNDSVTNLWFLQEVCLMRRARSVLDHPPDSNQEVAPQTPLSDTTSHSLAPHRAESEQLLQLQAAAHSTQGAPPAGHSCPAAIKLYNCTQLNSIFPNTSHKCAIKHVYMSMLFT